MAVMEFWSVSLVTTYKMKMQYQTYFIRKKPNDLKISKFIKHLRLSLSEFLHILPTCKNVYLQKKNGYISLTFRHRNSQKTGKFGGGEIKTKKQKLTNKTNQTNSKNQPDTCGSTYDLCFGFCTN